MRLPSNAVGEYKFAFGLTKKQKYTEAGIANSTIANCFGLVMIGLE